jgi:hypothetical protein
MCIFISFQNCETQCAEYVPLYIIVDASLCLCRVSRYFFPLERKFVDLLVSSEISPSSVGMSVQVVLLSYADMLITELLILLGFS